VRREPSTDGNLRVVTFNVAYARKITEAVAALRAEPLGGADVIVLQEMDAPGTASIAQALGLNYVYYPASRHPKTGRDFGNAILSPWPIEASRKVLLPGRARASATRPARRWPRWCAWTAGRSRSTRCTSPRRGAWAGGGRGRQADAVLADAEKSPHPVIVAGDFNSSGIGARFRAKGFEWPTHKVGHSAGPFSFDHVFVRGLSPSPGKSAGVAKAGPRASDHWPVFVVLARPGS
jgi:endonuclease/exonuclease/phosphatase family metal-dependent hydrolase